MMLRTRKLTICLLIIAFISFGTSVYAGGENDKTLSPYFFIDGGDSSVDNFPLKSTNVVVNISGVIADVTVIQRYTNNGTRPINARYIFPASTRAAVHGMEMKIGEKVIVAKIKERQTARKEFNQAKKEGKSASLLKQQRPNVFSMNVANIIPGDTIDIELHYTELLIPNDGTYEFVYPTVVGPRYSSQPEAEAPEMDQWVNNPYLKEDIELRTKFQIGVYISTGLTLQEVVCPSHETDIIWSTQSIAQILLSESEKFGGNRDFILKYRLAGQKIEAGLMLYAGEDENFFLLMTQPPERVAVEDIPPSGIHLCSGCLRVHARVSAEHRQKTTSEPHRRPATDRQIQRHSLCRCISTACARIPSGHPKKHPQGLPGDRSTAGRRGH